MTAKLGNPYQPPLVSESTPQRAKSRGIAIVFILACSVPTCLVLCLLGEPLFGPFGISSEPYSSAVSAVGFGLSVLTFLVGAPTSIIVKKFCVYSDHHIVDRFGYCAALPFSLGIVGSMLVDWITG